MHINIFKCLNMKGIDLFKIVIAHNSSKSRTEVNKFKPEQEGLWNLWIQTFKFAQLRRFAASLHTDQFQSYLNQLVHTYVHPYILMKYRNANIHRYIITYISIYIHIQTHT